MEIYNHKHDHYSADVLVVGGGLSGCFTALAAARHGAKVILIQDRPMLGGNASSEVRMWVRGAKGKYDKETGLISEFEERNIHFNPNLDSVLTDATLYDMVTENPNIKLFLNASVINATKSGDKIDSVTAWQLTTYTFITVKADYFADCSGDSILAPMVDAEFIKGREDKTRFNESLAQDVADDKTMGMSIILAARETDHPVKFVPPSFANVYLTDDDFSNKKDGVYVMKRSHDLGTSKDNLWWLELGGDMHSLYDADIVREKLLKAVYGVWDHIKNRQDHGKENWEIEWIGFLPGKRETYRYVGDHVVTEKEILDGGNYADEIAYGGWPLDDHDPKGMFGDTPSIMIPAPSPYGLPYRALYSINVPNLTFAGRNISASHVALSSTRVMATCALLGQALGTALAIAVKNKITPREVYYSHLSELQKTLMDDNVFLPHFKRQINDDLLCAKTNLPKYERVALFNGVERPRVDGDKNYALQNLGETLKFEFLKRTHVDTVRIVFDRDFTAQTISENHKMRVFAMKLHTGKDFKPVKTASCIVSDFEIYIDGKLVKSIKDNFLSCVKIPVNLDAFSIEIKWLKTHGDNQVKVYSFDII